MLDVLYTIGTWSSS